MDNIDESDRLVSVGTYLTGPEAQIVKTNLDTMGIYYVVNGHNAASRYNSLYHIL